MTSESPQNRCNTPSKKRDTSWGNSGPLDFIEARNHSNSLESIDFQTATVSVPATSKLSRDHCNAPSKENRDETSGKQISGNQESQIKVEIRKIQSSLEKPNPDLKIDSIY